MAYFPHSCDTISDRTVISDIAMGVLEGFAGVAVHDGWVSCAGYEERHGLCNAHHLRELTFLYEERRQGWA